MGIMSRVIRLCKADLHGVMDQIEDKDLLLRQYLREMQAAMEGRQARIDRLEERRRTARRLVARHADTARALEEDLARAVARNRDDFARMLIRKLLPLRHAMEGMARHVKETAEGLEEERERLDRERLAYDAIRCRVAAAGERVRAAGGMPETASVEADSWRRMPSEEEIEWELLQRKEAAGSGRAL